MSASELLPQLLAARKADEEAKALHNDSLVDLITQYRSALALEKGWVAHACPRRHEAPYGQNGLETNSTPDWWETDSWTGNNYGHLSEHMASNSWPINAKEPRTCSYCGSVHPEDAFALIESGQWLVDPTDKNYKLYLSLLAREISPVPLVKLYFQHFSDSDCDRFIKLYNTRAMKLGYPGHFYVRPFFVQAVFPTAGHG
jgi:hypothetical protein